MMTDPLFDSAAGEVLAMHDFIAAWFRGDDPLPSGHDSWQDAFADDFHMITPEGGMFDRQTALAGVHGARGSAPSDFRIEILAVEPVFSSSEAVLLIYIERQYRDGRTTDRRSTALFSRDDGAPRGVCWRHLQETWMQAV